MGDTIYIKFGDWKGSSIEDAHMDWSKVMSIDHGIQATVSGERDTKGGSNVGRPQHFEINFVKLMDAASMELIKACLMNTAFDAVIEVVRTTGGSKPEPYLKYELTNCYVTSISHSAGADGEGTVESGTLNYGVVKWDLKALDETGKAAGTAHAGWDREKNKEA